MRSSRGRVHVTSVVETGAASRGSLDGHFVHEIISRVEALASDGPLPDLCSTSTFVAAETRAFGIARTMSHTRDRADAAIVFADALVSMVIEKGAHGIDHVDALIESVAGVTGLSTDTAAFSLYLRASTSPQVLNLPPRVAAETHLRLLVGLAPISEASLWVDELGTANCVASIGAGAETRRCRSVAS